MAQEGKNRRSTRRGSYSNEIVNINDPEVWPLEVIEDLGVLGKCIHEKKTIYTEMEVDSSELSYDPSNVFSEGTDAPKNTMVVALLCVPIYKLEVDAEEEVSIALQKREACLRRSVSGRKGCWLTSSARPRSWKRWRHRPRVTALGASVRAHRLLARVSLSMRSILPSQRRHSSPCDNTLKSGQSQYNNAQRLGDIQSVARPALPIRELRSARRRSQRVLMAARRLPRVRLVCLMARPKQSHTDHDQRLL